MKRPRQWAAEIAALKTLNERRAALTQVPPELKELVQTHLRLLWEQRNGIKRD